MSNSIPCLSVCVVQVLAGVVANLPGLSAGLSMGFSAILIPQLQQPGAEIRATLEQGSWIASLFVIGDLLGCVIGGPIADRFGRRVAILVDCLPLCVGWLLTWQVSCLGNILLVFCIGTALNTETILKQPWVLS